MQRKTPVSQSGTMTLVLRTDKRYFNGQGQQNYSQTLVRLPGIHTVSFSRSDQVVNLRLLWEEDSGPTVHDLIVDYPELPGPPHRDGKIGLRQMAPTIGLYRNFRVWALTDERR